MRPTVLRILKHGLPVAVALAVLGYGLAEAAGMWVAAQPPPRTPLSTSGPTSPAPAPPSDVARQLRTRLPLTLAGWGFGLVAVFELLLHVWKGGHAPAPSPAPTPPDRPGVPTEDETEQLLNELLRQAEAAEAARSAGGRPAASDKINQAPV